MLPVKKASDHLVPSQPSEMLILQSQKPDSFEDLSDTATTTEGSHSPLSDIVTPIEGSRMSEDDWDDFPKDHPKKVDNGGYAVADFKADKDNMSRLMTPWGTLWSALPQCNPGDALSIWKDVEVSRPHLPESSRTSFLPLGLPGGKPSVWRSSSPFGSSSTFSTGHDNFELPDLEGVGCETKKFVDLDEEEGRTRGKDILGMLSDFRAVDEMKKPRAFVVPPRVSRRETGNHESGGDDKTEFGVVFKKFSGDHDNSQWNRARLCNSRDRSDRSYRHNDDLYLEGPAFHELYHAVRTGAERAFGTHMSGVTMSADARSISVICSSVLKESLDTALIWLRREIRPLLSTNFFGLRVAENFESALLVDYAAPQDHNELCYGFVKTGKCRRHNCTWWHEGSQQFVIWLHLDNDGL